jgi:hypothetical protein
VRSHLGNRIGIGLTGLVMLVVAGYALVMRQTSPRARVLDLTYFARHAWAHSIGAALLVLLALVVTRWLLLALGWGRCGSRTGAGTAMLGVLLKDCAQIHRMRVRVVGTERVRASVTCGPGTDLARVVRRLDPGGASRLRRAVDLAGDPSGDPGSDLDVPIVVRLRVRSE